MARRPRPAKEKEKNPSGTFESGCPIDRVIGFFIFAPGPKTLLMPGASKEKVVRWALPKDGPWGV